MSSASRLSTFMCTSSSLREKTNVPAAISASTWSSPLAISRASDLAMMPVSASIAACALEPRMSCGASTLSKPMEAFMSSMISAGGAEKRPPHIVLEDRSVKGWGSELGVVDGSETSAKARSAPGVRCRGLRARRAAVGSRRICGGIRHVGPA